ncbi:MAG: CCA tRNA nucleotidyltransferase [Sandaracinaceae bacterium]
MRPDQIDAHVLELCATLRQHGHGAWIVGGCVRDLVMGRPVNDWDVATSALPEDVQRIFRRTVPTGIAHGTITVLLGGGAYEVTTLRGESEYSDGRRPDRVEFVDEITLDLERRDFTVNAIAYEPDADALVDPWGGEADIARRVIRAVRDPALRFGEDGLRVLRAARFAATLEFTLDPATAAAIRPTLDTFRKVSAERVLEEWRKTMEKASAPSRAFRIMREHGILHVTCPRLADVDDPTFDRSMLRVDACPRDLEMRMAALLLDAGDEGRAKWVLPWLRDLRFSKNEQHDILHLMRVARPPASAFDDDPGLRRWLAEVGRNALDAALTLAEADRVALGDLEGRARAQLEAGVPLTVGELAIDGNDVMRALGGPAGRHVGRVLQALFERVLDDPSQNDRARLISLVPEAYRSLEGSA